MEKDACQIMKCRVQKQWASHRMLIMEGNINKNNLYSLPSPCQYTITIVLSITIRRSYSLLIFLFLTLSYFLKSVFYNILNMLLFSQECSGSCRWWLLCHCCRHTSQLRIFDLYPTAGQAIFIVKNYYSRVLWLLVWYLDSNPSLVCSYAGINLVYILTVKP